MTLAASVLDFSQPVATIVAAVVTAIGAVLAARLREARAGKPISWWKSLGAAPAWIVLVLLVLAIILSALSPQSLVLRWLCLGAGTLGLLAFALLDPSRANTLISVLSVACIFLGVQRLAHSDGTTLESHAVSARQSFYDQFRRDECIAIPPSSQVTFRHASTSYWSNSPNSAIEALFETNGGIDIVFNLGTEAWDDFVDRRMDAELDRLSTCYVRPGEAACTNNQKARLIEGQVGRDKEGVEAYAAFLKEVMPKPERSYRIPLEHLRDGKHKAAALKFWRGAIAMLWGPSKYPNPFRSHGAEGDRHATQAEDEYAVPRRARPAQLCHWTGTFDDGGVFHPKDKEPAPVEFGIPIRNHGPEVVHVRLAMNDDRPRDNHERGSCTVYYRAEPLITGN